MIFQSIPIDNSAVVAAALSEAERAKQQLFHTAAALETSERERGMLSAELEQTRTQLVELKTASGKLGTAVEDGS